MKPTILGIIGKPLAGKDTQADLLVVAHPTAVKISTGHIIRAVHEEGETHRFWHILAPYLGMMEQGLKLPDEPIIAMLGQVVAEQVAEGKKLIVIAGSPRSFDQLEGFKAFAEETGSHLSLLHIDVDDEETYRRSATRNEGRIDDTPEVHAIRLKEYETYVLPVVETLKKDGAIVTVDGTKPIEEVFRRIENEVRMRVEPETTLPAMAKR